MMRSARKVGALAFMVAVSLVFGSTSDAQIALSIPRVERKATVQPSKISQLGVYFNVQPDCKSGPLPVIRQVRAPTGGAITVKRGKVSATNFKQCLAVEVPGLALFYLAKPNFEGTDIFILEIRYASGKTELQRFTIEVKSQGRSI